MPLFESALPARPRRRPGALAGALPAQGDLFRGFVGAYFGYRLVVDFAKHADCRWLGLSTIQWVTVLGLAALAPDLRRWLAGARRELELWRDAS